MAYLFPPAPAARLSTVLPCITSGGTWLQSRARRTTTLSCRDITFPIGHNAIAAAPDAQVTDSKRLGGSLNTISDRQRLVVRIHLHDESLMMIQHRILESILILRPDLCPPGRFGTTPPRNYIRDWCRLKPCHYGRSLRSFDTTMRTGQRVRVISHSIQLVFKLLYSDGVIDARTGYGRYGGNRRS